MNPRLQISFILLIILGVASAFASTISQTDVFAFSKNEYADIRIDSNLDGKIDLWMIRNRNTTIKYYSSGGNSHIHIQSLDYPRTNILVSTEGGKRRIRQWTENNKQTFRFTQELCLEENNSSSNLKDLLNFPDITSEMAFDEITVSLIDESCDKVLDNNSMVFLQNSVALLLNKSESSLQSCLKKPVSNPPLAKIVDDIKLAGANAELNTQNFLNAPEEVRPLIYCEVGEPKNGGKFSGGSALYSDRRILIQAEKTNKQIFKDQRETTKVLMHEYFHHLGVEDEVRAELMTSHCNGEIDMISVNPVLAGNQSLALASANKAQEIVASSNQGISKAAAETVKALPSSPNVAPAKMAQIHKAAGASGVEAVSRSQTSGMLASANNLMGLMGTRATAATKSTGSSTRAPSSAGAATKYKADSLVTTKSRVKTKAGKAQAGETMVEEYVLGQRSAASAKRRPSTRQNSQESVARQPANVNSEQPTAAPTATVAPPRRTGGTETARSGTGGSGAGISSLPRSSGSAARGPANASAARSSGGSAAESSTSTEEYVTYFTQNSYAEVKQKLRDSEFVEKLKEASITVLDLRGTVYGAEKGNVILLDRGDRFVPQR